MDTPPLRIVFPASPLSTRQPDPAFEGEVAAAKHAGFSVGFVGVDGPADEPLTVALLGRPAEDPPAETAIYRGWLLRPTEYARLEAALHARGVALFTDAAAYRHAYHLPEWYAALEAAHPGMTPPSIWFPLPPSGSTFDHGEITREVAQTFGDSPAIVKDYVKSRKHEWFGACFLPSASDTANVRRITENFLKLQEDALEGGLVYRKYVPFRSVGLHSKSKLPLVREYRVFVVGGQVALVSRYWGEGAYEEAPPDLSPFLPLLPVFQSPFYALDIAEGEDGRWWIVEINDGGAAGIPDGLSTNTFHQALAVALGSLRTAPGP